MIYTCHVFETKLQNNNIVLSHCYACNITSEPLKQPHSTLNEMNTIIKCTNHNKRDWRNIAKPKLTEQPLETPFDTEWTHHRTTSMSNGLQLFTFKHPKGLRGRLQGTSHQRIWNNHIILSQWNAFNSKQNGISTSTTISNTPWHTILILSTLKPL